ncbi:capsular biosynthesis protein [Paenibacillus sp. GSMTC-2017]|uniref:YveK family protein n=1 Tax=Paenibacillus sp. GSMTC-2017 TaxID=2794350 RepID=UPI0018D87780|nr:Wzz/FepE/Etk N-terminal domain-containing protein [Paenibacillus sp. GSMTC-2017]MBH5317312.1 capsular biosynthesis protein [Paenibacillus sp. GSMTC-2017]
METKRVSDRNNVPVEKEIDLRKLFNTIKRRLWLIILITGLLTTFGFLYNSQSEPNIYNSSSRLIIAASNDMMTTVRALVREPIVLNEVIKQLELDRSVSELRSQIRVNSVDSSLITVISVVDSNPERAADIANSVVEHFKVVAADTLDVRSIQLLTAAEVEPFPINEKSNTIVYIAFIVGLILSVSLAFLLESLDDSIRTEQDVESLLGITVLGQVSKIRRRHTSSVDKKQKPAMVRSETIGS